MVQVLQVDFRFCFSFDILYQVDLQKGLEGEQRKASGGPDTILEGVSLLIVKGIEYISYAPG